MGSMAAKAATGTGMGITATTGVGITTGKAAATGITRRPGPAGIAGGRQGTPAGGS